MGKSIYWTKNKLVFLIPVLFYTFFSLMAFKSNSSQNHIFAFAKYEFKISVLGDTTLPGMIPDTNFQVKNVYFDVEIAPEFKGGLKEMYKWISENLSYPEEMKRQFKSGKVYVKFIVLENGKVVNPVIMKSPDELFSREVIRLINLMPKWKPGMVNGKPVNTLYTFPVTFKL